MKLSLMMRNPHGMNGALGAEIRQIGRRTRLPVSKCTEDPRDSDGRF